MNTESPVDFSIGDGRPAKILSFHKALTIIFQIVVSDSASPAFTPLLMKSWILGTEKSRLFTFSFDRLAIVKSAIGRLAPDKLTSVKLAFEKSTPKPLRLCHIGPEEIGL